MLSMKKGDKVAMVTFTGMRIGETFDVIAATKTEITISTHKGDLTFSRKTGLQLGLAEDKQKYANKIMDPAEAPDKKPNGRKSAEAKKAEEDKKSKKVVKKVVEPVEEDEDDFEDEDEEEEPAPKKPAKKAAAPAKKAPAKKAAPVAEEDDEDEDEFEDDEDEFEEI